MTQSSPLFPLISTDALAALMEDPTLRIVDGSWHLDGRDAQADFDQARLPGAVFFDLEAVSDHGSDLPHMLPTAEAFAEAVGALGIAATDTIVIYDTVGLRSAPRVWWTFRLMGATNVRVLDGGLPLWRAEGRPLVSGPAQTPPPASFAASRRGDAIADLPTVLAALTGEAQILDARPAARFAGQAAEPRAGLRSGHMPGALNLPFATLIGDDGRLLEPEQLRARFREAGLDLGRPVITSCGSGVTAAILTLALTVLDVPSRLYDGSWAEWGSRTDTPVTLG